MDPVSVTTACIALIGAVTKTSAAIGGFLRGCREARDDLTAVGRELSDLRIVLELLIQDTSAAEQGAVPVPYQKSVLGLVENCAEVVHKIDDVLHDHSGRTGPATWAFDGRDKVAQLRILLETHKGSLNIALELANLALSKAIKDDTVVIRQGTSSIKEDTSHLLLRVSELSVKIAKLCTAVSTSRGPPNADDALVGQWLESLTTYAETVCGDLVQDGIPGSISATLEGTEVGPIRNEPEVAGEINAEKTLLIHNPDSRLQFYTMGHADGRLVTTHQNCDVIIWDSHTGKEVGRFNSGPHRVSPMYNMKVAFFCNHLNSDYICVWDYRAGIAIWAWKQKKKVLTIPGCSKHICSLIQNGVLVIFWAEGAALWKAEASRGTWRRTQLAALPRKISTFKTGDYGHFVMLDDDKVLLLDLDTGRTKSQIMVFAPDEFTEGAKEYPSVAAPKDGSHVVVSKYNKSKGAILIKKWTVETREITSLLLTGYIREGIHPASRIFLKLGTILAIFFADYVDIIDINTFARIRYKTPFLVGEEFIAKQPVWTILFSREIDLKRNAQVSLSITEERTLLALRTNKGDVQLWKIDIGSDKFPKPQDGDADTASETDGSTLAVGEKDDGDISRYSEGPVLDET